MNRRLFGAFGVITLVALSGGSCKSDPLSDLDGVPDALVVDFNHLNIGVGDTATVTAEVLDGRAAPMEAPITFAACNGVVLAATDTSYHPIPATSARATVIAQTPAPSCVVVTGGGFTDTVTVDAVPTSFTGALSTTTPAAGDTMTIASTPELKFDTATVAVTFSGGSHATFLAKTPDLLTFLVPAANPGGAPLTIAGVTVTSYSPPLHVTLQTGDVSVTGDQWAGDTIWQTAPNITALIPAVGGAATRMAVGTRGNPAVCPEVVLGNSTPATNDNSSGPCMIFRFDVVDTTSVRFTTDWDGTTATDIDIYVCADSVVSVASFNANCFEDGGGGATGVKPQQTSAHKFTAGPHWFVIELFGGATPKTNYVTIQRQ
jgi:hypothetical protein